MPADVALIAPDEAAQVLAQPSPLAAFASAFHTLSAVAGIST